MHRQVKGYFDLANEYHLAAATLWTQIMDAPYLYNPISYLLRHTIELQLKGIIVKELRKDNKHLIINEIRIASKKLSNTHSLLILWDYCKELFVLHNILCNKSYETFINKTIKKVDNKDFSSTKYRYPFDRNEKATNLFPVDIALDGKAPDLEWGIPTIIQTENRVGIINKGQRLMKDTSDLFEVAEILFQLLE